MKKFRIISFLSLIFIFLLSACGKENVTPDSTDSSVEPNDVVYDYEYDIYNKSADEIIEQVQTKVNSYQGYILSKKEYNDEHTIIVYKVPVGDVDAFVKYIESFDTITSKIMTAKNVDNEYAQLLNDIDTLEVTKAAYESILAEYGDELSADKKASLRQEIIEIEEQITALNKQKAEYDDMGNYSTVTIDYYAYNYSNGKVNIGSTIAYVLLFSLPFATLAGLISFVAIIVKKRSENNIEE